MEKYSEKVLEKKLVNSIKEMGGWAVKFYSEVNTGLPDRIVMLPGGKIYFVEMKSTGKKQTTLQVEVSNKIEALGFWVYAIDTEKKLIDFLIEVKPLKFENWKTIMDGSLEDLL
jgi:Holliday junction resolvase